MQVSARRDKENSKAVLLNAAIAEFSKRGYAGARVDRIAALAGLNKRLLYYYFGDKSRIFASAAASIHRQMAEKQARCQLPAGNPGAALRDLVAFGLTYLARNSDASRILSVELALDAQRRRESDFYSALTGIQAQLPPCGDNGLDVDALYANTLCLAQLDMRAPPGSSLWIDAAVNFLIAISRRREAE